VDRAGPDHDHQPRIGAVQHAVHRLARLPGGLRRGIRGGKLAQDVAGGREFLDFADADIVGNVFHASIQ
jgi:hypothetical protein